VDQSLTQPAIYKPNWWNRNWKWFVPLGCFTVALLFLVFVSSVLVIVFSAIKSTDVYKEALARAKAGSCCDRSSRFPYQGRISRVGEHKRERRGS
jgi:hypothetical protein